MMQKLRIARLATYVVLGGVLPWQVSYADKVGGEVEQLDVKRVWAGHPVRFTLLSHGKTQFIAFYDEERWMTLAQREIPSQTWTLKKLDSQVGWDSHNSVTMALDREGHLHVSGNMHNVPLVYFRTTKPLDVQSAEKVPSMTGEREKLVTYPVFLKGEDGALVFNYRDGRSGNGATFYNVYDEKNRTWRRLVNTAVFDGLGKMNSYPQAPKKGPDGWYHMTWVWRDTPAAETNHDLSYAKSRDLVNWVAADGAPLQLPLTLQSPGTIVDPIPAKGGIINGSGKVGFDTQGNAVITYHKHDEQGMTQLYFARFEDGKWRSHRATDWKYRWEFSGNGSLRAGIRHDALTAHPDGTMTIKVGHPTEAGGEFIVDPQTFRLGASLKAGTGFNAGPLGRVQSDFPDMMLHWGEDQGATDDGRTYRLRWETRGSNRDQPYPKPWPPASMLQVISTSETGVK